MAYKRLSTVMRDKVIELHTQGHKIKTISRMLGVARNTVRDFVRPPVPDEPPKAGNSSGWQQSIPWDELKRVRALKKVTFLQLHAEYAPDVHYTSFWREWKRRNKDSKQNDARIRMIHPRAERTEIDYCDGIPIVDRTTGVVTKTHLFCAVLSFSDKTYGEFVLNQQKASFLESQDKMFSFFGGVTPYVVVDNLKSGVSRAHIYDPDVNPTYSDYAAHTGFAVLPARPRTPRDKPAVEAAIGVIQRQFFQEVRDRTFYSLDELNKAFRAYLERLNSAIMKDYGVSRNERFEEERTLLKPLPSTPFEISEYRFAKVHPDCHVQVERNFYSVPFQNIGLQVRVRLTPKMVYIYAYNDGNQQLSAHARMFGKGRHSTCDAHYPEEKLAAARFDIVYAKREANRIGPQTYALVDFLFDRQSPLTFLRRVQGILRLHRSVSTDALEFACTQAVLFRRHAFAYVRDCALRFDAQGQRPLNTITPARDVDSMHLHQTLEGK